jgi:uncharacterized protein (DUF2252 family)
MAAKRGSRSRSAAPAPVPHPTHAERVATGLAARSLLPLEGLGAWEAPADRRDPIALLEEQAVSRVPELVPIRYGRMVVSPFAFYRGAAIVMAADLAPLPRSGLQVQLGGDAHLANFGGYEALARQMVFDMNDFDETLPGPFEWDLKRLATSFAIVGRTRGDGRKARRRVVAAVVETYCDAMREFATMGNMAVWYSRLDVAGIIERWGSEVRTRDVKRFEAKVDKARSKDSLRAFNKLTHRVNGRVRIVNDPPLLVPVDELVGDADATAIDRAASDALRTYRESLQPDRRHLLEQFRFADLARKVVGVGSVGTRTWIAMLLGDGDRDPLFLQLKEARASVLEDHLGPSEYAHHGERVVQGQRLMQATSDVMLGWPRVAGLDGVERPFYVRQLWDGKWTPDPVAMPADDFVVFGRVCGWSLARAHARSGDRFALHEYLGDGVAATLALTQFAEAYADQNERDHAALADAVHAGRVTAQQGV